MMESSKEKKNLFYTIVLLLTLVVMIIGTTIAYFSLIASQKKDGTTLYTGTLAVSYYDGTYIKDPELFPLSYVDFNTRKHVYRNTFRVSSYGTLDQTIDINLDMNLNEFQPNSIKYAIFNSDGVRLAIGFVPKSGRVNMASNLFLEHQTSAEYTLIVWLSNTGHDQGNEAGKRIAGTINIYAKQTKY